MPENASSGDEGKVPFIEANNRPELDDQGGNVSLLYKSFI
jgi:hypothetical protein